MMKTLIVALGTLVMAGMAHAGFPPDEVINPHNRVPCGLETVCIDWNFAEGDQGFLPAVCEPGGLPVWEYGPTTFIPGAPGDVWGTVLQANYLNDSGDGLCSPEFAVTADCYLMEVYHYYDIETNYDGGNVTVNGVVVAPDGGYDATISTSTSFYAWCVDLEEGFTGHENTWASDCFDLSAFIGQNVIVCFDFGSDSSVTYPGWYIAQVQIGGPEGTPVDGDTWGTIKHLFK
ncbi:hypothetical protein ACFL6M_07825 [Candidatus Eisenbacteria bacterium]|uniref:PKD domain-containing protein n=1 Tax=Eiseniibacteriota bacterium TaxID=2212470 RepID=A0ABV6YMC1_UNCEI